MRAMMTRCTLLAVRAYLRALPIATAAAAALAGCACPPGADNLSALTSKIAEENRVLRNRIAEIAPTDPLGADPDGIKAGRDDAAVRAARAFAEACR